MKHNGETARSRVDRIARRKGEEQRAAAERGETVPFYIKEVAAKVLKPGRKSWHAEKEKDEA
jgi:hypothetical protein